MTKNLEWSDEPETDTIMVWVSTEHNHEGHQNQSKEKDDFEASKIELGFAKKLDMENVQQNEYTKS